MDELTSEIERHLTEVADRSDCSPEWVHLATAALGRAKSEITRLQNIIDSRPAINAGLPETYIRWSQSLYVLDAIQAGAIKTN